MRTKSNTQIGQELEQEVADLLGGVVHRGSGNQPFVKLDVHGRSLLFSCKATRGDSVTLTPYTFDEAQHAVHGPGGLGGGYLPAYAAKTKRGDLIICMEASDWSELFGREDIEPLPSDKATQRRRASTLTPLARATARDGD